MVSVLSTVSILGVTVLIVVIARSIQSRAWEFRLPEDGPTIEDGPFISVIVPARNEERSLKDCLPTILDQTYQNYEVIVVDDRSTDDTAQVLSKFDNDRLRIVHGEDPPDESWSGKCWAVHQGVQEARGDWFLFTDADMTYEPWLLSRVVADHEDKTDSLFSLLPQASCEGWWNKLVLPLHGFLIFLGFPIGKVNDPEDPTAIAAGGFMFMHQSLYEETGGHEAIRKNIAEDLALAKAVKETGASISLKTTEGLNSEHYDSPSDLVDGITKHLLAAPWPPLLVIPLGQIIFVLLYLLPVLSLVPAIPSNTITMVSAGILIVLSHLLYTVIHGRLNHSPLWGLLLIPAMFYYSFIGWFSLYHQIRYGGPEWKGRRIKQSE